MKKIKIGIFLFLLVGLFSFTSVELYSELGLNQGDKIEVESVKEIRNFMKQDNENFVLINFWASYNAQSRANNIRFAKVIEKYKNAGAKNNQFAMVSVSFDKFQSVFVETVKQDALENVENIFVKEGFSSKVAKTYQLEEGDFGNFVVDAQGVIVAKNVTPEEFEVLLYQN